MDHAEIFWQIIRYSTGIRYETVFMIIYTICMYMYVYKLEYSIVYRRTRERERDRLYVLPL